jgi:hypothetical protein
MPTTAGHGDLLQSSATGDTVPALLFRQLIFALAQSLQRPLFGMTGHRW